MRNKPEHPATSNEEFLAWVAERNAALETMDMAYAEKLMPKASPEVRLIGDA